MLSDFAYTLTSESVLVCYILQRGTHQDFAGYFKIPMRIQTERRYQCICSGTDDSMLLTPKKSRTGCPAFYVGVQLYGAACSEPPSSGVNPLASATRHNRNVTRHMMLFVMRWANS